MTRHTVTEIYFKICVNGINEFLKHDTLKDSLGGEGGGGYIVSENILPGERFFII